jgi:hypothetical protein
MSNRTYFINRSLLQKHSISRVTFVNNVNNVNTFKLYNLKNRQKMVSRIIYRNFHTNTSPLLFGGGGPGGSGPNITRFYWLILVASGAYISSNKKK